MNKVDNKWSWIVCGACFWTLLFIQGTVRSAGVFYASTVEQGNINRVEAAWPFNLCIALEGFGMFLTGISGQKNILCRGILIAVFLFSLAFGFSGLTQNILIQIVLIGVVGGLCHGYIVAASFICICRSFTHYRNIAMGISISGASLGGVVLSYLHNFLLETYTLNNVYILTSGASLQDMISAMLYRLVTLKNSEKASHTKHSKEREILHHPSIEIEETDLIKGPASSTIEKNDISRKKKTLLLNAKRTFKGKYILLKHPVLYIYTISFSIIIFCSWFWHIVIVDVAKDKGFNQTDALSLVLATSIAGSFGRFFFGWIVDFGWIKSKTGLIVSNFAMALVVSLTPYFFNIFVLVAISIVFGLSAGSLTCLRAPVAVTYFGINEMAFALGLNTVLSGGASLLRPMLIGVLREKEGNYDAVFYIHGALACFAGILWLMEPIAMKIYIRKQKEIQNEDEYILIP